MPNPVTTGQQAIDIANNVRDRGNIEYNYVTVTESSRTKFFPTREAQQADPETNGKFEVFRLRFINLSGAFLTDNAGNRFLTFGSNVQQS